MDSSRRITCPSVSSAEASFVNVTSARVRECSEGTHCPLVQSSLTFEPEIFLRNLKGLVEKNPYSIVLYIACKKKYCSNMLRRMNCYYISPSFAIYYSMYS